MSAPHVSVVAHDEVPADAVRACRAVAEWLNVTAAPQHAVTVTLVAEDVVEVDHDAAPGGVAFAAFHWPDSRSPSGPLAIYLASGLVNGLPNCDLSRAQLLAELQILLLHEYVHYQQWSAGREPTERGVTMRARHLHHKYLLATLANGGTDGTDR